MSIEHNKAGRVQVINVDGRLDQTQALPLETLLNRLLEAGQHAFLVDLSGTTYINSGGLRCLVSAWRKAQQQSGDLILCGLNERLKDIFAMVGFDKVFQIYPDAGTALQSMKK